ncbi:MAG TPA: ribosome small subunit-dependent GTPase A [Lachnospiraceae bacterium]|nr:ribosome small subunit-dependent GTPase A [Lachnospiraceae bacterium]
MRGKIIKGIAGFYYVQAEDGVLYACKAKGIFRNRKEKPLVGDNVEMEVTHEGDREGNITDLLPRSSMLLRPAVANVDQALVLFAVAKPKPNLSLLDRFLIMMDRQKIPALICFNKTDEASEAETERLRGIYAGCKSRLLFISAKYGDGLKELNSLLKGHTTTVAGPSGVGKSTLINLLAPHAGMETGNISEKIDRGKHTTRHSELFCLENGGYIFDTPGFSSLELGTMEKEELRYSFPEFAAYEGRCRFQGCVHINEPDCAVKQAVESGAVHKDRYESYRALFEELKEREKRRYT